MSLSPTIRLLGVVLGRMKNNYAKGLGSCLKPCTWYFFGRPLDASAVFLAFRVTGVADALGKA